MESYNCTDSVCLSQVFRPSLMTFLRPFPGGLSGGCCRMKSWKSWIVNYPFQDSLLSVHQHTYLQFALSSITTLRTAWRSFGKVEECSRLWNEAKNGTKIPICRWVQQ